MKIKYKNIKRTRVVTHIQTRIPPKKRLLSFLKKTLHFFFSLSLFLFWLSRKVTICVSLFCLGFSSKPWRESDYLALLLILHNCIPISKDLRFRSSYRKHEIPNRIAHIIIVFRHFDNFIFILFRSINPFYFLSDLDRGPKGPSESQEYRFRFNPFNKKENNGPATIDQSIKLKWKISWWFLFVFVFVWVGIFSFDVSLVPFDK